jgi:hypothetical protein
MDRALSRTRPQHLNEGKVAPANVGHDYRFDAEVED